jgi:rare lipoprotein A (peptidoglycan hydrolase)
MPQGMALAETIMEFGESAALIRKRGRTAMFLLRELSVPRTIQNSPVVCLMLVALLAQSCAAISDLSRQNDQSLIDNENIPGNANIQKVSIKSDGQKLSKPATQRVLNGTASWYGPGFHGKKTASGEIYDQTKFTAAHKTLPLGSKARVTNMDNGSTVEVEINDRGPFVEGRIIDLSRAAARALGLVESGTAPVRVELIADRTGARLTQDDTR